MTTATVCSLRAGPVLNRFDRFYQIGPRTLKRSRASGGPLLYYEAQNRGKCRKLNQCLIRMSPKLGKKKIGNAVASNTKHKGKEKLTQLFDRVSLLFTRKYL